MGENKKICMQEHAVMSINALSREGQGMGFQVHYRPSHPAHKSLYRNTSTVHSICSVESQTRDTDPGS